MKYKNYYKILELSGPRVSDDEIKSAYRKLAKKYHPDINPGNVLASEKFKDVNEAYQVLINEESKRKYNIKHFAYSFKDGINFKNIKNKIDTSGVSEFVEMFIGKQNANKSVKKSKNVKIQGENLESQICITLEEAFFGVNKKISFKADDDKTKTITIKVPNGIVNGGKIRIKGQGKAGKNGGNVGDLLIKINILDHKKFKLNKSDIIMDLPVTPSEAALGSDIEIDTLDSKVNLQIKSGTQSGEELHIPNKGYFNEVGERGDFIAKVRIVVPKNMSKQERKLYEELQKIAKFVPRRD